MCAAQLFCAFTLVCDCIFLLSCNIILLSCVLFFVILLLSFHNDFTLLPVLCFIRAPFSRLPSSFGLAPSGFNLSCLVLFLSISAASSRCFFAPFASSRFCKSHLLSSRSALRVLPAEARLTVYRRFRHIDPVVFGHPRRPANIYEFRCSSCKL